MTKGTAGRLRVLLPGVGPLLLISLALAGGYKARPWSIRPVDSYPSRLTSEGVTIAVEPLFLDALAAQFFDKSDIVTRGIMPVAIVIFNDNDFPVEVNGSSIELVQGDDRIRTLEPDQVVRRLFSKDKKNVWIPNPVPRIPRRDAPDADALADFEHKHMDRRVIEPHNKGGGFLYLRVAESDVRGYLAGSRIYIPDVSRADTGAQMIFFEIDLKPAVEAVR